MVSKVLTLMLLTPSDTSSKEPIVARYNIDAHFFRPNVVPIAYYIPGRVAIRGPTPEWVGWTATGPSPAEGHLPWPEFLLVGELAQVPHYPERWLSGWLSPPNLTLRGQAGSTCPRIRIQRQLALPGLKRGAMIGTAHAIAIVGSEGRAS